MADKYGFNVLYAPWIDVQHKDGTYATYGILDTLRNAHNIAYLAMGSPPVNSAVQRLLITFLLDVFRPVVARDIYNSLYKYKNTGIPMGAVEAYVAKCNAEGERFDLFDTEHPFLQRVFTDSELKENGVWDKKGETKNKSMAEDMDSDEDDKTAAKWGIAKLSVAQLIPELPSGSNTLFSYTTKLTEDEVALTPKECAQAVVNQTVYGRDCGRKKTTGTYFASKNYPVCFFYSGDSLFDTLVLSLPALNVFNGQQDFEGIQVPWRENAKPRGEKIINPSVWAGLMQTAVALQLLPESDAEGNTFISQIYIAQGYVYTDLVWTDPFTVNWTVSKGNKAPVQMTLNTSSKIYEEAPHTKELWTDLGYIMDEKSKPALMNNLSTKKGASYDDSLDDGRVELQYYAQTALNGAYTKGVPIAYYQSILPIYPSLTGSPEKIEFIKEVASVILDINNAFSSVLKQYKGPKVVGQKLQGQIEATKLEYMDCMHEYIVNSFIPALLKVETEGDWKEVFEVESRQGIERVVQGLATRFFTKFITKSYTNPLWCAERMNLLNAKVCTRLDKAFPSTKATKAKKKKGE